VTTGRLLAVDHGAVRIGLAISDAERRIASPLATYTRGNDVQNTAYFRRLIAEEAVVQIVVGLPVHLSGREGDQAAAARRFGGWLAEQFALPVVYFDERFSTLQAENALWDAGLTHKRRKERRDRVAAQILLQAFLEAGCPDHSEAEPL